MLTKVLEQKWVIRFFGAALIIAPFLNIFVSGEAALDPGQHMNWRLFWEFARGVPVAFKVLEISSLVIGVFTLRGSVSAWRYLLALLGGYIILQFAHLGHTLRTDKTAWLFIGVNLLAFFFIADQIVLKPREESIENPLGAPSPSATPSAVSSNVTSLPPVRTSRKKIVIDLSGVGRWARLIDISSEGLHVRCLSHIPEGVLTRDLVLTLGESDYQLHYVRESKRDVYFEWQKLEPHQVRSLNAWIHSISA